MLWAAVAVDDPPSRNKRIEDTRLVPIILDLVTAQDIDEAVVKGMRPQTRRQDRPPLSSGLREGGVLSLADVSLLMRMTEARYSASCRTANARPARRCRGAAPSTTWAGRSRTRRSSATSDWWNRSLPARSRRRRSTRADEVEYYVQCFRRVQLCRDSGMVKEDIARATGHSLPLVQEYLDLIEVFRLPRLPSSHGERGIPTSDGIRPPVPAPFRGAAAGTQPREPDQTGRTRIDPGGDTTDYNDFTLTLKEIRMYYKGMSLRVVSAWCMSANPRPVGRKRHRSLSIEEIFMSNIGMPPAWSRFGDGAAAGRG